MSSGQALPSGEPARRPLAFYKQDLIAAIGALAPASVLDVGCGDGALLRALRERGCARVAGIEVAAAAVEALRTGGIDAHVGRAEALAFADASFDVVVFDYVAHHVENLERALLEAARVARRAVVILDPWYDLSIASQRVAYDYDLWSKRLDRRAGMIHNPPPSADRLTAPFRALGGFALDCRHRLILQPVPVDSLAQKARARLAELGNPRVLEDGLEILIDRARLDGFSEDGAILMVASRANAAP